MIAKFESFVRKIHGQTPRNADSMSPVRHDPMMAGNANQEIEASTPGDRDPWGYQLNTTVEQFLQRLRKAGY